MGKGGGGGGVGVGGTYCLASVPLVIMSGLLLSVSGVRDERLGVGVGGAGCGVQDAGCEGGGGYVPSRQRAVGHHVRAAVELQRRPDEERQDALLRLRRAGRAARMATAGATHNAGGQGHDETGGEGRGRGQDALLRLRRAGRGARTAAAGATRNAGGQGHTGARSRRDGGGGGGRRDTYAEVKVTASRSPRPVSRTQAPAADRRRLSRPACGESRFTVIYYYKLFHSRRSRGGRAAHCRLVGECESASRKRRHRLAGSQARTRDGAFPSPRITGENPRW